MRSLGRKWQLPVSDGLKGSQGDLKIQTPNCYEIEWARCKMRYPSNTLWHAFFYTTYIQQEKNQQTFGWTKHLGIPGKDSKPVGTPIHWRQDSEAKCVQMPRWLRVLKLGENFMEFSVEELCHVLRLHQSTNHHKHTKCFSILSVCLLQALSILKGFFPLVC